MNRTSSIPLEVAITAAELLLQGYLAGTFARAVVAGSVRRQRPHPHDVELVVEPYITVLKQPGLFGPDRKETINLFDQRCDRLLKTGILEKRVSRGGGRGWGERAKRAIYYYRQQPLPVDIFSVIPPTTWGVLLAIRTGPGDFNKLLVTHAHSISRKVAGGRVWDLSEKGRGLVNLPAAKFLRVATDLETIETDTEEQFFGALGVPAWSPELRTETRLREYLQQLKQEEWK